jgi:spermidine synthase
LKNETRKASTVAFISSFCVMAIELIAGRMLAPAIGVSLYTWTSVIGIIMAGIAAGNYAGGKVADRRASPSVLALVLAVGAGSTIAVSPAAAAVTRTGWLGDVPVLINLTARITISFLLPSFVLSMVSPLAIKLALSDRERAGRVVGTVYAWSTGGSIAGAFLTGFLLVSHVGTYTTAWMMAAVLIATGIAVIITWKPVGERRRFRLAIAAAACLAAVTVAGAALFNLRSNWEADYTRETNYYAVKVHESGANLRILQLDHIQQSYVVLNDPTALRWNYPATFGELVRWACRNNPQPRVLHLGGGGYTMPRFMEAVYPGSRNDVVEIDPAVTEVAYELLGLPRATAVRSYNEDARMFLARGATTGQYDIVIGDVFNDLSAPFHLTTVEFNRMVKARLAPGGIYKVNIIDDYRHGRYLASFVKTMQAAFENVYLLGTAGEASWHEPGLANYVVVASDRPVDMDAYLRFLSGAGTAIRSKPLETASLTAFLTSREAMVLSDDRAPTEVLMAPLFLRP